MPSATKPRPIARLVFVLGREGDDARANILSEALCERMAHALEAKGVKTARHTLGVVAEGALRADVALWFPQTAHVSHPTGEVSAHTNVLLAPAGLQNASDATGFDAVLVPHETLVAETQSVAQRAGVSDVLAVRICASAIDPRAASKSARQVNDKTTVLVDLRDGFERDIDRTIFHLTLAPQRAAYVLLVPHHDKARAKTRDVCARHGLNAYLASGPLALSSSIPALDVFVGRPDAETLLLLASHQVAVAWLSAEPSPPDALAARLIDLGVLKSAGTVLQLSAALERLLKSDDALFAQGAVLADHLVGSARGFLDALGSVRHHAPRPKKSAAWERVGPFASAHAASPVVSARAADAPTEDKAAAIEAALSSLKARLSTEATDEGGS